MKKENASKAVIRLLWNIIKIDIEWSLLFRVAIVAIIGLSIIVVPFAGIIYLIGAEWGVFLSICWGIFSIRQMLSFNLTAIDQYGTNSIEHWLNTGTFVRDENGKVIW